MEKFDGEAYSKETYEKARRDSGAAWGRIQDAREKIYKRSGTRRKDMREIYNRSWINWKEAKKRVEELYAKGNEEAVALDQEYNRLQTEAQEAIEEYDRTRTRAEEAIEAIANFEREELGMRGQQAPDSSR